MSCALFACAFGWRGELCSDLLAFIFKAFFGGHWGAKGGCIRYAYVCDHLDGSACMRVISAENGKCDHLWVCWRWTFFGEDTNDKQNRDYFPAIFGVVEPLVGLGMLQLWTCVVGSCLFGCLEIWYLLASEVCTCCSSLKVITSRLGRWLIYL